MREFHRESASERSGATGRNGGNNYSRAIRRYGWQSVEGNRENGFFLF